MYLRERSTPGFLSESFVTFYGHPQPPLGDYFLLICITDGAVDKRNEKPAVAL